VHLKSRFVTIIEMMMVTVMIKKMYLFSAFVAIGVISFSPANTIAQTLSTGVLHNALPSPQGTAENNTADLNLLGNFGNNIVNSFRGNTIYLHLTAVAATAIIVDQGVDYDVEHYFNQHTEYGSLARPVVFTGEYLPFIAGGSLLAYAKLKNDREVLGASFAVLQASLIEFLYNSALKAVTGRPNPDWRHVSDMDSLSRTFRFGFLRGGVFWGWPSGHTAATMAVVSALTSYYPDKTWLKVVGLGLVGYTMFGVSANNRGGMHWFSDAVAGALMSYAVGSTVGKYYRNVYSGPADASSPQSSPNPSMGVNPTGVTVTFIF
jgi:membrane-associated phospholipid phosphatase